MPQSHKREDHNIVENSPDSFHPGAGTCSSKGNVDVADEELVVTSMPATPEGYCGRVVGEAANHVFGRVNAVY